MRYAHPRWTRVLIAPAVANLDFPTLTEIAAGADVSQDVLVDGGLSIVRSDQTVDRTPWRGPRTIEAIGRYSVAVDLSGPRRTAGDTETLWSLAGFKSPGVLIVRSGVPRVTAWAADQVVEAIRFRFGKRTTLPADGGAVKFTVHLAVIEDVDDGVLVA